MADPGKASWGMPVENTHDSDGRRKKKIIIGVIIAIAIIAVVNVAGCISIVGSTNTTPSTSTNAVTSLKQPVSTVTTIQRTDPIIGVWRETYPNTDIFRFNADGTFIESDSINADSPLCVYGTWSANGNNQFMINSTESGVMGDSTAPMNRYNELYMYDPEKNIIYYTVDTGSSEFDVTFARYTGDVLAGCIPPTPVSVEGEAQIISEYSGWKSYGDFYSAGIVRNNEHRSITVNVIVDVYNSDDVKVGTGSDVVTVDPYGKSKFEAIVFGENGNSKGGSYRVYIDKII